MGLFGLTGITLNNATTIVPPLIMALALCDTVHIFSHMEKSVLSEFSDRRKALASVLKRVVMPCFLTTLTTAIGFLSLATSEIPPIREFAWIASAGMVFEFIYSFFFLPPLILFFAPEKIYREYHPRSGMVKSLSRINDIVHRHNKFIVVTSCLLVLTAYWFITRVRIETNLIDFFKGTSAVRTSIEFVEKRLGGISTLDISLKSDEEDAFIMPSNLKIIESIQRYIMTLNGVDVTLSFIDFIKDMNKSFHDEDHRYYRIPESRELVAQYLLLYDSDYIEDFINSNYDHTRILVRISEHSSVEQERIIREIQNCLSKTKHSGIDFRVTGDAVQYVNITDALVKGQIYSLSLATGIISIILFVVFRSVAIGCLSIISNLFPIILNLGIMGLAGIPLSTATSLISAVALGIVVDDTVHFLSGYKEKRIQGLSIPESVKDVIFLKGRAILSSSLILSIGFTVLVLSRFVPTIHFGMLCAIIMITALIGDLVILPSVLLLKSQLAQNRENV